MSPKIKDPQDAAAIEAMLTTLADDIRAHGVATLADDFVREAYKLGYERAAKIALDAQQAEKARKHAESVLDELEKTYHQKRCSVRFALAAAFRAGAQYIKDLPADTKLEFPGGTVDTSGMKPEPAAPTTLSDPENGWVNCDRCMHPEGWHRSEPPRECRGPCHCPGFIAATPNDPEDCIK